MRVKRTRLPKAPFDVVVVDPPWPYGNVHTGGSMSSGSAAKYETITVNELAALPVASIMAKASVCFLWAPTPLGDTPFQVMKAWGYTYKTKWYWHKFGRLGMGFWTRGQMEEVLIGVRGPVRPWRSSFENYLETNEELALHTKPERHSKKPEEIQDRIELLTPGRRHVELFARRRRPRWACYGIELNPTHDMRRPEFWASVGQ